MLHIVLHALVPLFVARMAFASRWPKAWLWMMAAMLIDLDHVLAEPMYDAGRCSIGFHPLHTGAAAAAYALLLFFRPTRILGIGLAIHLTLDAIDCQVTNGVWWTG